LAARAYSEVLAEVKSGTAKCVAEHSRRSQIVERDFVDHMPKRKVSNGAVAEPIFDAVQRRTSIDWT